MKRRGAGGRSSGQAAKATGQASVVQVGRDQTTTYNIYGSGSVADRPPGPGELLLRPVAALKDPFDLEVHPSVQAVGGQAAGLGELPVYVRREHDELLDRAVARAAAGHSEIAVLVADSSAGKTRACWEAVHAPGALLDDWVLWHPIDARQLVAGLEQIGPRTVLWLNETQRYLLSPGSDIGERAATKLRELLRDPARGPILVLGALWTEYNDMLTAQPARGEKDVHAQARTLLIRAGIRVPDMFLDHSLEAVKAAAVQDPRLALGRVPWILASCWV
jgi:hypothetical protein